MSSSNGWRNRIVGSDRVPPDQLLANPRNWRRHPPSQQQALHGVLEEVGWVQDVLVNQRTGFVVDGHLRIELALRSGQSTVPVTYLDLSDQEEALILATFDPLSALATRDDAQLDALLADIQTDNAAVQRLLEDLRLEHVEFDAHVGGAEGDEWHYSRAVESPVYTITGACPDITSLVESSRMATLLEAIEAAEADDAVKRFLRVAATRHLVFDYAAIAEFYAHADPTVQALMEQSALIILDVDQAIDLGFARLMRELRDVAAEEAEADGR
jgi:hypothetical protein